MSLCSENTELEQPSCSPGARGLKKSCVRGHLSDAGPRGAHVVGASCDRPVGRPVKGRLGKGSSC